MKHVDLRGLGEAVAAALAAGGAGDAAAAPGDAHPGAGYLVTVTAAEGGAGVLQVHVDEAGAAAIAERMGPGSTPAPAQVIEVLKDVVRQACAMLLTAHGSKAPVLVVESVQPAAQLPDGVEPTLARISFGHGAAASLASWSTLEWSDDSAAPAVPGTPSAAADPAEADEAAQRESGPDLDVILDMELPLVVRFGRTELTLKSLASLAPGAVIDLGRPPDEPVDVLVSNQVVARGEVVTVDGHYGVRITDIVAPADRVRDMEVTA